MKECYRLLKVWEQEESCSKGEGEQKKEVWVIQIS